MREREREYQPLHASSVSPHQPNLVFVEAVKVVGKSEGLMAKGFLTGEAPWFLKDIINKRKKMQCSSLEVMALNASIEIVSCLLGREDQDD